MLSESLKGVISQTLCKKIGGGRVAALEVLIVTSAISNLIREAKTFQIQSMMQVGKAIGMVTLNDALMDLVDQEADHARGGLRQGDRQGRHGDDDETGRDRPVKPAPPTPAAPAAGAPRAPQTAGAGRTRSARLNPALTRLHGLRTPCYIRQVLLELGHPI